MVYSLNAPYLSSGILCFLLGQGSGRKGTAGVKGVLLLAIECEVASGGGMLEYSNVLSWEAVKVLVTSYRPQARGALAPLRFQTQLVPVIFIEGRLSRQGEATASTRPLVLSAPSALARWSPSVPGKTGRGFSTPSPDAECS